jgi:2'-5' RNA ligase
LGNIANSTVEKLLGLFDETYQRETHFQYMLTRLTRFPGPAGRIIALINGPDRPLDRLFQNTLKLLQHNNLELDRKAFRPHLTLGRIKRPKHAKTIFDQQTNICLNISKIRLYQSTITESGSIYTSLKETQLS